MFEQLTHTLSKQYYLEN
ncbi:hypothetical protein [Photorhabdus luminescens]